MFSEPRRNHPTLVVERIAYYLFALAVVGFNALSAGTQDAGSLYSLAYWKSILAELTRGNFRVLLSGAGLAVLLVALIALSVIRWSRTYFYVRDGILFSERKTLFRKFSRLPVENITTVNLERNLFEKLLGTTKIKIDINSATTANKTDFVFVLTDAVAGQLKEELLSLRANRTQDEAEEPPGERTKIAAFTNRDAVRHKLLCTPFLQILTALLVVVTFLQSGAQTGELPDVVSIILLPLAFYLVSLVVGILNLCGFTLETDSKNLYITHGLIRLQSYTFEKKRVKAVFIRQSLLARICRLYSVELAVVGLGNEKNESPRLCLLVKRDEMERILSATVPAYRVQAASIPSEKLALLPGFLKTALCTALAATAIPLSPVGGGVFCAVVLGWGVVASVLSQKTRSVAPGADIFACSCGILNKKTGLFRYSDLQEVRFRTNPVMRGGEVGRMAFSILSAQTMAVQRTGWFTRPVYENLAERTAAAADSSGL